MLRHLSKLVWKRKGRNLMVSLEIMIAFLIVFAVAAMGLRYAQVYREPVGFVHEDVWSIDLQAPQRESTRYTPALFDQLSRAISTLPQVRHVGFASSAPYIRRVTTSDYKRPGSDRFITSEAMDVSDGIFEVLSIPLVAGRPFDARDNGAAAQPAIIDRRIARELFGDTDPIGKTFGGDTGKHAEPPLQVVGMVDSFRRGGELATPASMILTRDSMLATGSNMVMMVIKVAPGTPRQFEEQLLARLKAVRADWSYTITPLSAARASAMRSALMPLVIMSIVAVFMLLMVGVGLFGVLWQNITQRIPEIGLRRAVGASSGDIYRQVLAEQMLQSSAAILVALALLVQLPLTGALGETMNWPVFLAASVLSAAVIYLLSLACALYPSWRASRLTPTNALQYE